MSSKENLKSEMFVCISLWSFRFVAMSTPSGDTPAGPAPSKISHWDFMLFRQHDALLHYLSRLAALDARDGSALVSKVLDQRVEQVLVSMI
jgi:hypothetical protein